MKRLLLLAAMLPALLAGHAADYGIPEGIQDGNILHCFDWKHEDIIAEMPRIAAAGFGAVQISPIQRHNLTTNSVWYDVYRPWDYDIVASPMGDENTLKALCEEGAKYGVKIVVDVVMNHIQGGTRDANNHNAWWNEAGRQRSNPPQGIDYNNRKEITEHALGNYGDVNTENADVQQRARQYLDKLYSLGVAGVRYDATKHIGLPSEYPDSATHFWQVVTAESPLYHYGEILSSPGGPNATELMKEYASYVSVTDDGFSDKVLTGIRNGGLPATFDGWIQHIPAAKIVYWGESHDTFGNNGPTRNYTQNVIDRAWALLSARQGETSLYFSRPSSTNNNQIRVTQKGSTHFVDPEVAYVNHLRNAAVGKADAYGVSSDRNAALVARQGIGAVIVVADGKEGNVTLPNPNGYIPAGTYYDKVGGQAFTVTATEVTGKVGAKGIAVIYKAENAFPSMVVAPGGGIFRTETLTVKVVLENLASGWVQVDGGERITVDGPYEFTIGDGVAAFSDITVAYGFTKDEYTFQQTVTFTKRPAADPVYVWYDNPDGWLQPTVHFGTGDISRAQARNMTYDPEIGKWYYLLPEDMWDNCSLQFSNNGSNKKTAVTVSGHSMLYLADGTWGESSLLPSGRIGAELEHFVWFNNDVNWAQPYVWAWNASSGNLTRAEGWPGEAMEWVEERGLWRWIVPGDIPTTMIFNNGEGTQSSDKPYVNRRIYWNGNTTQDDPAVREHSPLTLYLRNTAGWQAPAVYAYDNAFLSTAERPGDALVFDPSLNLWRWQPADGATYPVMMELAGGNAPIETPFVNGSVYMVMPDGTLYHDLYADNATIYLDATALGWTAPKVKYYGKLSALDALGAYTVGDKQLWAYTLPAGTTEVRFTEGGVESKALAVEPGKTYVLTATDVAKATGIPADVQGGNILHCFDWTHADIIAELPRIAAAGFGAVQVSPLQRKNLTTNSIWYDVYRPWDFDLVASPLGNEETLKQLCEEAAKYGVKIIVDVVFNHVAGGEPDQRDPWWDAEPGRQRDNPAQGTSGNRTNVTEHALGDYGDVNTENPEVQLRARAYLDKLASLSVAGVRYDATKHIGLPSEYPALETHFWQVVTENSSLYHYGEILSNPGGTNANALMKEYTDYVAVTDDGAISNILRGMTNSRTSFPASFGNWITKGIDPSRLVYWGESHDTFANDGGSTKNTAQNVVDRTWALVSARQYETSLYFSRPPFTAGGDIKVGQKGSMQFTAPEVAAVNRLRNAAGNAPALYYRPENRRAMVARQGVGAVIVVANGLEGAVSMANPEGYVPAGEYVDEVSGNTFTVTAESISGTVGATGIAVIYKSVDALPNMYFSRLSGSVFRRETMSVTARAVNFETAWVKVAGQTYTVTPEQPTVDFSVGADIAPETDIVVEWGATLNGNTVTGSVVYSKLDKLTDVYVWYNNPQGWEHPYVSYSNEYDTMQTPVPMSLDLEKNTWLHNVPGDYAELCQVTFSDGPDGAKSNTYTLNSTTMQLGFTQWGRTNLKASEKVTDKPEEFDRAETEFYVYLRNIQGLVNPTAWAWDSEFGCNSAGWPGDRLSYDAEKHLWRWDLSANKTFPTEIMFTQTSDSDNHKTKEVPFVNHGVYMLAPDDIHPRNLYVDLIGDNITVYLNVAALGWEQPQVIYGGGRMMGNDAMGQYTGTTVDGAQWVYTLPAGTTSLIFGDGADAKTVVFTPEHLKLYTLTEADLSQGAEGVYVWYNNPQGWEHPYVSYANAFGSVSEPAPMSLDLEKGTWLQHVPADYADLSRVTFSNGAEGETTNSYTLSGNTMQLGFDQWGRTNLTASENVTDNPDEFDGVETQFYVYLRNIQGLEEPTAWAWDSEFGCNTLGWPGDLLTYDSEKHLWRWDLSADKTFPTEIMFTQTADSDNHKTKEVPFVNHGVYMLAPDEEHERNLYVDNIDDNITVFLDITDLEWEQPHAIYEGGEMAATDAMGAYTVTRAATQWVYTLPAGTTSVAFGDGADLKSEPFTPEHLKVYTLSSEDFNTTGILTIGYGDEYPVEWYDLQGRRIEHPTTGIYIRRQGTTATKVIM